MLINDNLIIENIVTDPDPNILHLSPMKKSDSCYNVFPPYANKTSFYPINILKHISISRSFQPHTTSAIRLNIYTIEHYFSPKQSLTTVSRKDPGLLTHKE